jgi:hypothetical protein
MLEADACRFLKAWAGGWGSTTSGQEKGWAIVCVHRQNERGWRCGIGDSVGRERAGPEGKESESASETDQGVQHTPYYYAHMPRTCTAA